MRVTQLAAVAAAAALALSGCAGSSDDESSEAAGSGAFPVTIEHALGQTTIESAPERVATVAWANHEVPLAFDIVPVGMSKAVWGDDDGDGVLPWVTERLEELGAETPVLFDETEGIDFEAVADTQPDVILAAYSGLTEDEYETLSKIAPVVAYPETAWGTTWEQIIELNSAALGRAEDGAELIAELRQEIDDATAGHPELEGTSALFAYLDPNDLSQVGFYTIHDPRASFLAEAGLVTPSIVTEASADTEEFYVTHSAEEADAFDDVDVIITYGDPDGDLLRRLQADPLLGKIPAIERGAVAILVDDTPLAAAGNPSALSIPWGLDDYLAVIAEAAGQGQ